MNIVLQDNLNNLHQFWLTLGAKRSGDGFSHNQWPNKHWQPDFGFLSTPVEPNKVGVTVETLNDTRALIKSQLTVMSKLGLPSLDKDTQGDTAQDKAVWIKTPSEVRAWVSACGQAFGYEIDEAPVLALLKSSQAHILAHYTAGEINGTAIGFQTANTFGIHQLGTLPAYRGKGIAKSLMMALFKRAKALGCDHVSLQASQAGLPLYEKLGFESLGKIISYDNNVLE